MGVIGVMWPLIACAIIKTPTDSEADNWLMALSNWFTVNWLESIIKTSIQLLLNSNLIYESILN